MRNYQFKNCKSENPLFLKAIKIYFKRKFYNIFIQNLNELSNSREKQIISVFMFHQCKDILISFHFIFIYSLIWKKIYCNLLINVQLNFLFSIIKTKTSPKMKWLFLFFKTIILINATIILCYWPWFCQVTFWARSFMS